MKRFKPMLLVLAVAALTVAAGTFRMIAAGADERVAAEPGISFSLRILGRELLGFSFQDSRSTKTSWINEHEEK